MRSAFAATIESSLSLYFFRATLDAGNPFEWTRKRKKERKRLAECICVQSQCKQYASGLGLARRTRKREGERVAEMRLARLSSSSDSSKEQTLACYLSISRRHRVRLKLIASSLPLTAVFGIFLFEIWS